MAEFLVYKDLYLTIAPKFLSQLILNRLNKLSSEKICELLPRYPAEHHNWIRMLH